MKHTFVIILFLLSCTALGAEPMAATIDRYVRTLGIDGNLDIVSGKNQKYGDRLIKESGFNTSSLVAFGSIGGDTFKITLNKKQFDLVGSPIEYYYTDLVFMKKEYGKALTGLYRNLAEMPGKRAEVNEAIGLVKEVARRRGERCDEQAAKARYAREIRAEIEAAGRQFSVNKNELDLIKSYYLGETNYNNFQNRVATYRSNYYSVFEKIVSVICTLDGHFGAVLSADTIRF